MSFVISDEDVNNVVNEVEEFLEGMLCHYTFYATYNIQWRELLKLFYLSLYGTSLFLWR